MWRASCPSDLDCQNGAYLVIHYLDHIFSSLSIRKVKVGSTGTNTRVEVPEYVPFKLVPSGPDKYSGPTIEDLGLTPNRIANILYYSGTGVLSESIASIGAATLGGRIHTLGSGCFLIANKERGKDLPETNPSIDLDREQNNIYITGSRGKYILTISSRAIIISYRSCIIDGWGKFNKILDLVDPICEDALDHLEMVKRSNPQLIKDGMANRDIQTGSVSLKAPIHLLIDPTLYFNNNHVPRSGTNRVDYQSINSNAHTLKVEARVMKPDNCIITRNQIELAFSSRATKINVARLSSLGTLLKGYSIVVPNIMTNLDIDSLDGAMTMLFRTRQPNDPLGLTVQQLNQVHTGLNCVITEEKRFHELSKQEKADSVANRFSWLIKGEKVVPDPSNPKANMVEPINSLKDIINVVGNNLVACRAMEQNTDWTYQKLFGIIRNYDDSSNEVIEVSRAIYNSIFKYLKSTTGSTSLSKLNILSSIYYYCLRNHLLTNSLDSNFDIARLRDKYKHCLPIENVQA